MLIGVLDGFGFPVLDFEYQHAAARMEYNEVRAPLPEPDGHVIPEQIIVFELLFEPFGKTLFATGHARKAAITGRNE